MTLTIESTYPYGPLDPPALDEAESLTARAVRLTAIETCDVCDDEGMVDHDISGPGDPAYDVPHVCNHED